MGWKYHRFLLRIKFVSVLILTGLEVRSKFSFGLPTSNQKFVETESLIPTKFLNDG